MKKTLLVGVAAAALLAAQQSHAADLGVKPYLKAPPMAPVVSWTGCYAGAHVGWGWGRTKFTDHTSTNVVTVDGTHSVGLIDAFDSDRDTAGVDQSGPLFGGQIGCDYQFQGNWVLGISGSAAGAAIYGRDLDPYAFGGPDGTIESRTDFLGDISGRLGFTWNQMLLYGKAGVAWAHNRYIADTAGSNFAGTAFTASNTATGLVAGGGIEWAFVPNWTVFVEYNHYFFDTKTVNFSGIADTSGDISNALVDVKQDLDVVKVGLNYRLNWGGR